MLAISLCLGSLVSVVVRHHRLKVRLVSNQRAFDGEKKTLIAVSTPEYNVYITSFKVKLYKTVYSIY